ncbi:MAG: insulinase family protein [Gemmatimonadaceae bacterium]
MKVRPWIVALFLATPLAVPSAQELVDSITVAYEMDGLQVLHHRKDSRLFAVHLYLLGGSRQVTEATAGVEPLILLSSDYGTADYPGDAARRVRAQLGSSLWYEANRDWTLFAASGLREDFDSTWALFTSRLLRPTLDTAAIAPARLRLLSAARRQGGSPEAQAFALAESLAFAGHPYAVNPAGNATSLAALTPEQMRSYAREQFVKSRMLLVVVGDVPREHVDSLITRSLGTLPRGSYTWSLPAPISPSGAAVVGAYRRSTTTYVYGYMHGPLVSSPDYPAFQYAMGILSGLVSSRIREQQGLSYAAGVGLVERGVTGAVFNVSTTRPDSVIKLFNRLLGDYEDQLRIPTHLLKESADGFRANYLFGMEGSSSHAEMLARAQLYDGDYRAAARRAEVMKQVRSPDLRRMVRTYGKNIQYAFVGDTSRIPEAEIKKR